MTAIAGKAAQRDAGTARWRVNDPGATAAATALSRPRDGSSPAARCEECHQLSDDAMPREDLPLRPVACGPCFAAAVDQSRPVSARLRMQPWHGAAFHPDDPAAALAAAELADQHRPGEYGSTEDGVYSTIVAWWSREQWLDAALAVIRSPAGDAARQALRVGQDVVEAAAMVFAAAADGATGRNSMPGNAALARQCGRCLRTVQNATSVLEMLGLLTKVSEGKSWLTRAERAAVLWANGSDARSMRAVYACTLPRPVEIATDDVDRPSVSCILPSTKTSTSITPAFGFRSLTSTAKPRLTAKDKEDVAPLRAPKRPTRRGPYFEPAVHDLATDLRQALESQLGGTPHGRMLPAVSRFARKGWTAATVKREINAWYQLHNSKPPFRPVNPPGWLAFVLRQLEPDDSPDLLDAAYRLSTRQLDDHDALAECEHGVAGGRVARPNEGTLPCPMCRVASMQGE